MPEVNCTVCGKPVNRAPYKIRKHPYFFCGNACRGIYQRAGSIGIKQGCLMTRQRVAELAQAPARLLINCRDQFQKL